MLYNGYIEKFKIDITSSKIFTKLNRVSFLFLIEKNGNFCNNTEHIIKDLTEQYMCGIVGYIGKRDKKVYSNRGSKRAGVQGV